MDGGARCAAVYGVAQSQMTEVTQQQQQHDRIYQNLDLQEKLLNLPY